jgi:hypothetical protein
MVQRRTRRSLPGGIGPGAGLGAYGPEPMLSAQRSSSKKGPASVIDVADPSRPRRDPMDHSDLPRTIALAHGNQIDIEGSSARLRSPPQSQSQRRRHGYSADELRLRIARVRLCRFRISFALLERRRGSRPGCGNCTTACTVSASMVRRDGITQPYDGRISAVRPDARCS